jgi:sugar phosphate isomerase/epimerase
MAAVSGTYNMAHPDAAARADGQRRLDALIAATAGLGTPVVTLCTGTRDATDMWRRHPDNCTPEAWRDMIASIEAALTAAEAHNVTLAFEPEHSNIVNSAAAGRRLLDEIRSPCLRVIIDPANLFDGGDLDRQRDTLREAFQMLGDDLVLAHAKDLRTDASASWIRSAERHRTTTSARARRPWRLLPVWRMTATTSSTVGGSAGKVRPLLAGSCPAW